MQEGNGFEESLACLKHVLDMIKCDRYDAEDAERVVTNTLQARRNARQPPQIYSEKAWGTVERAVEASFDTIVEALKDQQLVALAEQGKNIL